MNKKARKAYLEFSNPDYLSRDETVFCAGWKAHQKELAEGLDYEKLEEQLNFAPLTYVPALLAVIIGRCRREPIFKGWLALQSSISRTYRRAGEELKKNGKKD